MKIKLTIEVDVDDAFGFTDDEEKMWFENEVLIGDGSLILHSNEIGDYVGVIKKISNIQYIPEEVKFENPNCDDGIVDY